MINMILTKQALTVILDGETYTISKEHKRYKQLLGAVKSQDIKKVRSVIAILNTIENWDCSDFEVRNRKVYFRGELLENVITQRIIDWIDEGLDPKPLINFTRKIMSNPSYQSRQELFLFLEHSNLPITPEGDFVAYKVVNSNYKDKHTNTFDNSIGAVCEMPRESVDDNRQHTCSSGLHFCSKDYVSSFSSIGDRLMLISINPRDVVSIPYDYNNAKGRCCKYKVIEEIKETKNFKSSLHRTLRDRILEIKEMIGRAGEEYPHGYDNPLDDEVLGKLMELYNGSVWELYDYLSEHSVDEFIEEYSHELKG